MDINDKKLKLKELIDQFHKNVKQYKSSIYDEANTRVDFIDKFFELMDWDIRNNQGFSEQYREVIREDRVKIEGKQKAPDYSFRIGGVRKFFVEAKKPGVDLKDSIEPAFQVRRYGYSAKIPLSILTDFEELSVYDTRIKPDKTDKASTARIFYSTFEDYDKHFDFIFNTFSKNAILKGSFDKYIEENKNKKGTSEIDRELLKLIEEWRTELAKNIALRNNEIDIYNLNNAVQKIIDRIIFLRIAEDREIEPYENLLKISKNNNVYENLDKLFQNANNKYNAGLFKPEEWLSKLIIDDKVLSGIIKEIYYPCPYEFSILPIEILGNIYEQFLGKTIRFKNVKEGHTAVIEEKPEVRKAGGVYYTPQYIVNYIVENTVGEKIKGKSPEEITSLKICDPACGSGSFLVGAYSFLLNCHLDYYSKDKNIKKALKEEKIYQIPPTPFDKGGAGGFKLTIEEKQKILINNIYGVDIDQQAVEVTKLSLYLKLLENESVESKDYLFSHTDIKLLPTLDNNIKCGNSLIGSDFYNEKEMSLFGNDEMRKVNVFDWEKEFQEVFKRRKLTAEGADYAEKEEENGGFDVVIGNPPYVRPHNIEEKIKRYIWKTSKVVKAKGDLFAAFMEKAIVIANLNAMLSFIVPNTWLSLESFEDLRKFIFENNKIISFTIPPKKVFQDAIVETIIFIFKKCDNKKDKETNIIDILKIEPNNISEKIGEKNQSYYKNIIDLTLGKGQDVLVKIENDKPLLQNLIIFYYGLKTGDDEKFLTFSPTNSNDYKKIIRIRDISRYYIDFKGEYVNYRPDLMRKNKETARPGEPERFEEEKIIIMSINTKLICTYDNQKYYVKDCLILKSKNNKVNLKYISTLINSRLLNYYYNQKFNVINVLKNAFLSLPIKLIDFSNPSEKQTHDRLVSLVDQMLETQKKYHEVKSDNDKKMFKQKIDIIDKQIDDLVYKLYGLTEEEIGIVEGQR